MNLENYLKKRIAHFRFYLKRDFETIQIIPEKIDTLKEYSDQIKQSNNDEYFTIIKLTKWIMSF